MKTPESVNMAYFFELKDEIDALDLCQGELSIFVALLTMVVQRMGVDFAVKFIRAMDKAGLIPAVQSAVEGIHEYPGD